MRKYMTKAAAALMATAMFLCATDALAGGVYGFGSRSSGQKCDLWTLPFPVAFQKPTKNERYDYDVNVIWVDDDSVRGMDKYYNLYRTPDGKSTWTNSPRVMNGQSTLYCEKSNQCTIDGGSVGKGISAYDNLVQEFSKDSVHVYAFSPNSNGDYTWLYLPVHKVKVLRVEYFTPYDGAERTGLKSFVEPLYFEYRATGNGSEMKLNGWGSTSVNTGSVKLPDTFDPVLSSDIQVSIIRDGSVSSDDSPKVVIHSLDNSQLAIVPGTCK